MKLPAFFTSPRKHSYEQLSFAGVMLSGAAMFVLAAVFVSGGGVERVANTMAAWAGPQMALSYCGVFHCNNASYEMEALFPEDTSGAVRNTFAPGQTINWQWNAGSYGANNFMGVCRGSTYGSNWACAVTQGSPRTDFSSCPGTTYTCTQMGTPSVSCDKYGCSTTGDGCLAYNISYGTAAQCGNADLQYGWNCFSSSGGTVPSCPGYPGNWPPSTTQTTAPSTPGTYTYYFYSAYLAQYKGMGAMPVTITVGNGTCSNGLGSSYYPSCTCPSGQVQSGSTCVAQTTCANGLSNSYLPSCTCPSGQVQSGSSCICPPGAPPQRGGGCTPTVDICTDISGMQTTLPAGCTGPLPHSPGTCIPTGYTYNGFQCVPAASSCSNGLNSSYLPSCACPSGQVQSGASCVAPGVINSLTANPTRVRKGNTAVITWSTANMASCALKGPQGGVVSTLSQALSSSLTVTVASQSTYTLTCVDTIGTARSQSVTINLVPEVQEQ